MSEFIKPTTNLPSNWELVDPPQYSQEEITELYQAGNPLTELVSSSAQALLAEYWQRNKQWVEENKQ